MNVDKKAAQTAGYLYLVIILGSILGGVFTNLYMESQLAGETGAMMIPDWLYRIGFAIYLLVYLSDLAAAVILYGLLKPVNKSLALLAAALRLAEAIILSFNLLNYYNAFLYLQGTANMSVFQLEQQQALAAMALSAQRSGYLISQVFFGVHCYFLGYLLMKSGYFPRILGIFLITASVGYLLESFSYFLIPNFEGLEAIVSWISAVPAFLAELSLTYWLLFKGKVIEKQYKKLAVFG